MPGLNFNSRAKTVRLVTVDDAQVVTVDDRVDPPQWRANIKPPREVGPGEDAPPRERAVYRVRWPAGRLAPPEPLGGGCRVETSSGIVLELLGAPRERRRRARVYAYEAQALPVEQLYPWAGELQEQGGAAVMPIIVSLWGNSERHEETGEYEDMTGEAPVEFADELHRNRQVVIGGRRHRIIAATTDYTGPRVMLDLRRAGG